MADNVVKEAPMKAISSVMKTGKKVADRCGDIHNTAKVGCMDVSWGYCPSVEFWRSLYTILHVRTTRVVK